MSDFPNILAQIETAVRLNTVDTAIVLICGLGVVFFVLWVFGFAGSVSLTSSPVRRNCIGFFMPVIQIGIWLLMSAIITSVADAAGGRSPRWLREFYIFLGVTMLETGLIVVFLIFARNTFARRLRGFGLNLRTVARDFPAAAINFITVLPLIFLAVLAVDYIGRLFAGPDFKMQANESLTVILENPQLMLRILMILFAIVVGPVFEEVLFRGMLQSMIRGYLRRPWLAIVMTSVIFATHHPWMHWPGIFILSAGMGYAYEKSGSLFRPIFIHAFFNAMSVTASLLS